MWAQDPELFPWVQGPYSRWVLSGMTGPCPAVLCVVTVLVKSVSLSAVDTPTPRGLHPPGALLGPVRSPGQDVKEPPQARSAGFPPHSVTATQPAAEFPQ